MFMARQWETAAVPGFALKGTLQRLTDEGYEIEYVFEHGLVPVQKGMIQGGPAELSPVFTIVAWKQKTNVN